jgi:hypothetical protein
VQKTARRGVLDAVESALSNGGRGGENIIPFLADVDGGGNVVRDGGVCEHTWEAKACTFEIGNKGASREPRERGNGEAS